MNRFQRDSVWDHKAVNSQRIRFLQRRRQTRAIEKGLIIVDDTHLDKTGKKIEGASVFKDSSGKKKYGHCVVSTHYKDPKKEYPLFYDVYRRKKELQECGKEDEFKTKLRLAKDQVELLASLGVKAKTVVFDCWYFAVHFVKFLRKLGLDWVTRAQVNRIVHYDGIKISLKDLFKLLPGSVFEKVLVIKFGKQNEEKFQFVYQTILEFPDTGLLNIVMIKKKYEDLEGIVLVTNRLDWNQTKIVTLYKSRWAIETSYRDSKQNLGLGDCQSTSLVSLERHITCVFLAYSLLEYQRLTGAFTRFMSVKCETLGQACQLFMIQAHEELIQELFLQTTEISLVKRVLREFRSRVTLNIFGKKQQTQDRPLNLPEKPKYSNIEPIPAPVPSLI